MGKSKIAGDLQEAPEQTLPITKKIEDLISEVQLNLYLDAIRRCLYSNSTCSDPCLGWIQCMHLRLWSNWNLQNFYNGRNTKESRSELEDFGGAIQSFS